MKLITWNCNMAFRKKAHLVLAQNPDILIIQECECLEKLRIDPKLPQPTDALWFGDNPNKGLGIFSYSDFRFRLRRNYNPKIKLIIPLVASNGETSFNLFPIWAHNPNDPDGRYVEQVWKALHHYNRYITRKNTILIGDFNSNTIWDKKYRIGNHSHVVQKLERKGIKSAYHLFHDQVHGKEQHPTFYLYKHKSKAYHIDYSFISADLSGRLKSAEIGKFRNWMKYSDHVPVKMEIII